MATIERLREVGELATRHYQRLREAQRRDADPPGHFRIASDFLSVWVDAKKVPLDDDNSRIGIHPWNRYGDPPATHGADVGLYRRLLGFFADGLGHWVGQDRTTIGYDRTCNRARMHTAAHRASRLRWLMEIHSGGRIDLQCYQDGLVGPGRKNGPRYSIETKHYDCLGDREKLWWRYLTWRLGRWLVAEGLEDWSEPEFHDAEERVEWRVRQSGHFKGEHTIFAPRLRDSITNPGRDNIDADGRILMNGDQRYFVRGGRLLRGRVFYNLNMMWWVVAGGEIYNEANWALQSWNPGLKGLRRIVTIEERTRRLGAVKGALVKVENYERAAKVRDAQARLMALHAP